MNLLKAAMVSVVTLGSVASSFATRGFDFGNLDNCCPSELQIYQGFAYPDSLQTRLLRTGGMEKFTWTEQDIHVNVFKQVPSIPADYEDSGKTHRLKGKFRSGDGREVHLIAHLLVPVINGKGPGCYIMVDDQVDSQVDNQYDFGNLDNCYPTEFHIYQRSAYPDSLQTRLLRTGRMEEFTWTERGDHVTVFKQAPSIPARYKDSGKTHRLKGEFRSVNGEREVNLTAHMLAPINESDAPGCYIMVDNQIDRRD